MDMFTMNIVLQATLGLAVFLFLVGASPRHVEGSFNQKGHLANKKEFLRIQYPLYAMILTPVQVLAPFNRKLKLGKMKEQIQETLDYSGNPLAFTVYELLAFCEICGLALPIVFSAVSFLLVGTTNFLVILIGFACGFLFPFIWINDKKNARLVEINRSLPYVLDLMCLAMEAGLDFNSTVRKIVSEDTTGGPLPEEMHLLLQEMKMGKTRRSALVNLAERTESDNLKGIVGALIQADKLGNPLGPVLKIQSQVLRLKRSQKAEKMANEAPVKLMFPLLFIFTSIFLVLFGNIIIKAIRGQLL